MGRSITTNFTMFEALGHAVIWIILSVITFGIAAFFAPYSIAKFFINRTEITVDGKRYIQQCNVELLGNLGHLLLWVLIVIVTFGLGYFLYIYHVWVYCISKTELIPAQ
ncbi:DUF6693 family protein [Limisalsivibrio acetivorans]|uniref:DUF6693 family protein n=1 Tax=Limisalsivibrio acetivorans TaxID=1304888 RepID=UPI0003B40E4C|nr:DUF6693 family protein [Limisalsivibrio acetivorans]